MHGKTFDVCNDTVMCRKRDCGRESDSRKPAFHGSPIAGSFVVPSIESYFSMIHADVPASKKTPVSSIMSQNDDMTFSYNYEQIAWKNPTIFLEKLRLRQIVLNSDVEAELVMIANSQISEHGDSSRIVVCVGMTTKMTVLPVSLVYPEFLAICESQIIETDKQDFVKHSVDIDDRLTLIDTPTGQAFLEEEAILLQKVDEMREKQEIRSSDVFSIVASQRLVDKSFAMLTGKKVANVMDYSVYTRIERDLRMNSFSTRAGYNFVSEKRSLVDDQKVRQTYFNPKGVEKHRDLQKEIERDDVMKLSCFRALEASAQFESGSYENLCPPFMIEFGLANGDMVLMKFFDLCRDLVFFVICDLTVNTKILDLVNIVASSHTPYSKYWSTSHILDGVDDLPQDRDILLKEVMSLDDDDYGDEELTEAYYMQQLGYAEAVDEAFVGETPLLRRRHLAMMKAIRSRFVVHQEKRILEFELDQYRIYALWSMLVLEEGDDDGIQEVCDVYSELRDAQVSYQNLFCRYGLNLEDILGSVSFDSPDQCYRFWYNSDPSKFCNYDFEGNFSAYKYGWMSRLPKVS